MTKKLTSISWRKPPSCTDLSGSSLNVMCKYQPAVMWCWWFVFCFSNVYAFVIKNAKVILLKCTNKVIRSRVSVLDFLLPFLLLFWARTQWRLFVPSSFACTQPWSISWESWEAFSVWNMPAEWRKPEWIYNVCQWVLDKRMTQGLNCKWCWEFANTKRCNFFMLPLLRSVDGGDSGTLFSPWLFVKIKIKSQFPAQLDCLICLVTLEILKMWCR